MNAYKIRINFEIVPTTDFLTTHPVHGGNGFGEFVIPESEAAASICVRLLATSHPVIHDVLSRHLSTLSKKALPQGTEELIVEKAYPYWVGWGGGTFRFYDLLGV